ncbi:MAG: uncharacterized protein KVP18_002157 [Porospora cf. gigantea A]|uniref:uncharacterized protein n=2 Tax=Porospora cf. gigantea A TaxID=2853593 RepID=UPI00355A4964|nr:MAG: hypothetical protein KVP18_002157 [Porospora cf. gigantea A]
MCAVCGAEVREDRVKVGFLGKDTVTMVPALASSLETTKMAELLASRRLVLVLDLDHTIAHACPWPRTSLPVEVLAPRDERLHGEAGCPHYMTDCEERQRLDAIWEANVFRIVIEKEGCEGKMLRPYDNYFKLRPGVLSFLRDCSENFELYLYTAGVQEHAVAVRFALKILDPASVWFGGRIFARSFLDAGGQKSMKKIFPSEHRLVIVCDDTVAVWPEDTALCKVWPYHYFDDFNADYLRRLGVSEFSKFRGMMNGTEARFKRSCRESAKRQKVTHSELASALHEVDSDRQLPHLARFLTEIHRRFFYFRDNNPDLQAKLSTLDLIDVARSQELHGRTLRFDSAKPYGANSALEATDYGDDVAALGADVVTSDESLFVSDRLDAEGAVSLAWVEAAIFGFL